jgi:hypothetical protein
MGTREGGESTERGEHLRSDPAQESMEPKAGLFKRSPLNKSITLLLSRCEPDNLESLGSLRKLLQ